jgi:hypothetical protein
MSEGTTVPEFAAALQKAGVRRVIDVRALPLSRRGLFKVGAENTLGEAGIEYVHLKALGTPAERICGAQGGMPILSASTPASSSFPKPWRNRPRCSILPPACTLLCMGRPTTVVHCY